jgi:hypothetical protein
VGDGKVFELELEQMKGVGPLVILLLLSFVKVWFSEKSEASWVSTVGVRVAMG